MRLAMLLMLAITACTTPNSPPPGNPVPPSLCASVTPNCAEPVAHYENRGLPATKTVQVAMLSPTLINGKPADGADWPASVYARAGNAACSATLVGDRVLFMASHCMDNGGTVTFSAHANNYKARCQHHPEYRGNSTADWALCLVDRPVTGVPFEVMGVAKVATLDKDLLLSGYGCIHPGGGGGNDGIFRTGNATVKGLPSQSGKNYDIVTRGGGALCFGDSGGSAYLIEGDNRFVIAVNSRGDIATMSYLPAVYSKTFITWADSWSKGAGNVRICGLHNDAQGCRQGEALPSPDGKFEINSKAACIKGAVAPDYLGKKESIIEAVRTAVEQF